MTGIVKNIDVLYRKSGENFIIDDYDRNPLTWIYQTAVIIDAMNASMIMTRIGKNNGTVMSHIGVLTLVS
jgi:hypothetical protein